MIMANDIMCFDNKKNGTHITNNFIYHKLVKKRIIGGKKLKIIKIHLKQVYVI